jgi:hypothetical protein
VEKRIPRKGTAVTVVEEGFIFNPYTASQVHWFVYDRLFELLPRERTTLWFGAPYLGGSEPGWRSQDFGHVSVMIFPDSPSEGPLEIVKEGVKRVRYELEGSLWVSQVRLITLHNPTDGRITFLCRGISAPVYGGDPGRQPTPLAPRTNEMNLLVLHDGQEGRIVAAGERYVTQGNLGPCGFMSDEGQQVAQVSVPEEISRLGRSEIYENFVVDVEAEQPTLKRKPK